DGPRQPIGAAVADQIARLNQLPDHLFDEEWVAPRPLMDELGEAVEGWVISGEVGEQLLRGVGAERDEREAAVNGGVRPFRLIFGPEVHQQQGGGSLDGRD